MVSFSDTHAHVVKALIVDSRGICRYRGIYEAMRAWYSEVPEEHIQPAKDSLEDTKLVLEAGDKDVAYIVERLRPLKEMIEAVEEAITLE